MTAVKTSRRPEGRRYKGEQRNGLGKRLRDAADPESLGGWFAQVDARGATADRNGHGLVVLALVDAQARAGAKLEAFHELEKLGIFFEDAENFVGAGDFGIRQPHRAEFSAQLGHSAEEWNAVRAADVAAEPLQQQRCDLRRNAVLQALGFFVRARPINADDVGEKLFSQPMTKNQVLRDSLPFHGKDDAAVAPDMQVAGAGHAFQRVGYGGGRNAKVFGQARADWRLLLLHKLPDSF